MSEIKRYAITQVRDCSEDMYIVDAAEHPNGEWVRWEDVQELLRPEARFVIKDGPVSEIRQAAYEMLANE